MISVKLKESQVTTPAKGRGRPRRTMPEFLKRLVVFDAWKLGQCGHKSLVVDCGMRELLRASRLQWTLEKWNSESKKRPFTSKNATPAAITEACWPHSLYDPQSCFSPNDEDVAAWEHNLRPLFEVNAHPDYTFNDFKSLAPAFNEIPHDGWTEYRRNEHQDPPTVTLQKQVKPSWTNDQIRDKNIRNRMRTSRFSKDRSKKIAKELGVHSRWLWSGATDHGGKKIIPAWLIDEMQIRGLDNIIRQSKWEEGLHGTDESE